jgi:cyanophycinase
MAIGGAEDKSGDRLILRELVRLAGGRRARLVVIPVASDFPRETGARYAELFAELGVSATRVLELDSRAAAGAPSAVRAVERASGIFFTGGTQARIPRAIAGTALELAIHRRFAEGALLAGTSAGAAAMSDVMIVQGKGLSSARRGLVQKGAGLGLLSGVIVDQHFAERGRQGRLIAALAEHPRHLGLGIDEDTAALLVGDELEVLGSGSVCVLDASGLTYTNADETTAVGQRLALCDLRLHVLPAGQRFNLRTRRPIPRPLAELPFEATSA